MCDKTPSLTARAALVTDVPPDRFGGGIREEASAPPCSTSGEAVLDRHLRATTWQDKFSRRTFLQGAAACPALLLTPSLVAVLPNLSTGSGVAAMGEGWDDRTFWDDGTGWV